MRQVKGECHHPAGLVSFQRDSYYIRLSPKEEGSFSRVHIVPQCSGVYLGCRRAEGEGVGYYD